MGVGSWERSRRVVELDVQERDGKGYYDPLDSSVKRESVKNE